MPICYYLNSIFIKKKTGFQQSSRRDIDLCFLIFLQKFKGFK